MDYVTFFTDYAFELLFLHIRVILELGNDSDRIKCIIITEDDPNQITQNYFDREQRIQTDRSALSSQYNNWLKEQIKASQIIV